MKKVSLLEIISNDRYQITDKFGNVINKAQWVEDYIDLLEKKDVKGKRRKKRNR